MSKFKPKFKQLIKLRENVQNRKKVLGFQKKKWERLLQYSEKKLRFFKKFKSQDQTRYLVTKYPNKGTSFRKRFRNTLQCKKRLGIFYGGVSRSFLKKNMKMVLKQKKNYSIISRIFLELFETRLDTILTRAKFCYTIRNAMQLIAHGKVTVNNSIVKSRNFKLKQGDLIAVNLSYAFLVKENARHIQNWPIPPKHLLINYRTLQIIVGDIQYTNLSNNFVFNLQLEKILFHYLTH